MQPKLSVNVNVHELRVGFSNTTRSPEGIQSHKWGLLACNPGPTEVCAVTPRAPRIVVWQWSIVVSVAVCTPAPHVAYRYDQLVEYHPDHMGFCQREVAIVQRCAILFRAILCARACLFGMWVMA
jgi:hypothetical protein